VLGLGRGLNTLPALEFRAVLILGLRAVDVYNDPTHSSVS
jgi:hypothetical protein